MSLKKRPQYQQGPYVLTCVAKPEAKVVYEDIQEDFAPEIRLGPGAVIVDVGANIGQFSVEAFDRCGREARVLAFEPIPWVAEILQENFERIDPARLKAFASALGAVNGRRTFADHQHGTVLSHGFPDETPEIARRLQETILRNCVGPNAHPRIRPLGRIPSWLRARLLGWMMGRHFRFERVECDVVRLSDVIRSEDLDRVDLLKIKAEGMDREVLEGIDDEHWPLIRQITAEIRDRDGRLEWVRDLAGRCGFRSFRAVQNPIYRGSEVWQIFAVRGSE